MRRASSFWEEGIPARCRAAQQPRCPKGRCVICLPSALQLLWCELLIRCKEHFQQKTSKPLNVIGLDAMDITIGNGWWGGGGGMALLMLMLAVRHTGHHCSARVGCATSRLRHTSSSITSRDWTAQRPPSSQTTEPKDSSMYVSLVRAVTRMTASVQNLHTRV